VPYLILEGKFDLNPPVRDWTMPELISMELSSLNAANIFPFRWSSPSLPNQCGTRTHSRLLCYSLFYQVVISGRTVFQQRGVLVNRVQRSRYDR
jgi:hypothetical protein